jgi:hypothetical protein
LPGGGLDATTMARQGGSSTAEGDD